MAAEIDALQARVDAIQSSIDWLGHYVHGEFVVSLAIGAAGLYYAWQAYKEAQQAKKAATEAGKVVRIQAVTVELSEILQKIARVSTDVSYSEARNTLTEINIKLRRYLAPYEDEGRVGDAIKIVFVALETARTSLEGVRPTSNAAAEVPMAVYNAIEGPFNAINGEVGSVLGLLEVRSTSTGEKS